MSRLRTFIAVDIGKAIRDRAVALQETLERSASDVKWVEPENMHLTLLFLGEVNFLDVPDVCRCVSDCCRDRSSFTMSVESLACFGNPRRPRTLWVGVDAGKEELVDLHDALEQSLLDLGCYRREERAFTPHITIGRVTSDQPNDELAAALHKRASWRGGEIAVREVLVLSSELTSKGPIYTTLGRGKLKGSAKVE